MITENNLIKIFILKNNFFKIINIIICNIITTIYKLKIYFYFLKFYVITLCI